ncbi:MAG: squalene-hopene/tetraprenyl-beta-curcumene cyclase [Rhodothermales bacterium]|jgi:squalene-hopene/tetraprenyl-beta-curcumene cyclase
MRCAAILLLAAFFAESAPLPKPQADTLQDSLREGAEFLLSTQHEDGSWSTYKQPAIAALCAIALYDAPVNADKRDAAIDKAMEFVLSFVQEGGAIAGDPQRKFVFFKFSSYPNYSTAISLLAMATVNKPEYEPIMRAARDFLRTMQVHESGSEHYGGFGYDVGKKSDGSNTGWAVEALHATDYLDHESFGDGGASARKTKAMWSSLATFLEKTQNLAADSAKGKPEESDGGFGYRSGMVSSGSMTYQGLKSMVYAKLDRQDPRVAGAMKYIRENYQIDGVPGSDLRGYYYYLQTMAKALDAYGDDELDLADGSTRNWRVDLVDQLASLQRDDGSWLNEQGRYMEAIPELVTAYALISLKTAK